MTKRKELSKDTFFTVYKWMSRLQITPDDSAKRQEPKPLTGLNKEIYAIIYGYSQEKEGSCFYSYSQFTELTGATRKAVATALKVLERNNLITVSREKNGKAYEKTFYKVNWDKIREANREPLIF